MLLAAPFTSLARYLWHLWYLLRGRGSAPGSARRQRRPPNGVVRSARPRSLLANARRLCRQRREIRSRASITPAVFRRLVAAIRSAPGGWPSFDPRHRSRFRAGPSCRPSTRKARLRMWCAASARDAGVPVLVIDDCSKDGTLNLARAAGAESSPCRTTWGSAAACRRATTLAHELGFEYVIRVDGDGQHDARDIPRILERLKSSRCEDGDRLALVVHMVRGRFERPQHPALAGGYPSFSAVLRAHPGATAWHDPLPDSWA